MSRFLNGLLLSKSKKIDRDSSIIRGRRRVDGPFKCLIRQTDNSDNSVGDRIENSATEITRSSYNVKAARGNFICDRINAKSIDSVASLNVNPRRTR